MTQIITRGLVIVTAVFAASIALLIITGMLAPPDPNFTICSTTSLLVERQNPLTANTYRSDSECSVHQHEYLKRVRYAYSTGITRRNHTSPIRYDALIAQENEQFILCAIRYHTPGMATPLDQLAFEPVAAHPLCGAYGRL